MYAFVIFDTLPPRSRSLILLQNQEFCHLSKIKMQQDILDMVTIFLDLKNFKKIILHIHIKNTVAGFDLDNWYRHYGCTQQLPFQSNSETQLGTRCPVS